MALVHEDKAGRVCRIEGSLNRFHGVCIHEWTSEDKWGGIKDVMWVTTTPGGGPSAGTPGVQLERHSLLQVGCVVATICNQNIYISKEIQPITLKAEVTVIKGQGAFKSCTQ